MTRVVVFGTLFWAGARSPLHAQEFRIGFVGGTPITSTYSPSTTFYPGDPSNPPNIFTILTGAQSFIAGPSVEAMLSERFSIEGNVLHRNLWAEWHLTNYPGTPGASTTSNRFVNGTTWEFPVLFKYSMRAGRWRPFIDGGVSFRSLESTPAPGPSRHGYTAGAGIPIELGRIQITPQLRYTRWAPSESNGYYDVKRDQLEFLTGISYRMSTAMRMGSRRLEVGVLGGVRVTETLAGSPSRLDKRALAGASLEVNVRGGFSIEGDGIYKPIGTTGNSVLTWEFPILLKYHCRIRGVRLLGEAGPSFRASGNLQSSIPPSSYGFTAGAGIEKSAGPIRIAPVLRYTRWSESQRYPGSRGSMVYNPNSLDVIVGVSF